MFLKALQAVPYSLCLGRIDTQSMCIRNRLEPRAQFPLMFIVVLLLMGTYKEFEPEINPA